MKKSQIILAALFAATLFTVSCGEKEEKTTSIYGVITFMKGDVKVNQKAGQIGVKVVQSDTIAVKADSVAVIQFTTNAQITIESNTTIEIAKLLQNPDGKNNIAINQKSGSTFSKVIPGQAEYNISTPAVTAGVRGTSFRVAVDETGQKTKVQLLRGKVAVKKKAPPEEPAPGAPEAPVEETILLAGNELEATSEKIKAPVALDEKTTEKLSKLDKVAMVPKGKLKKIEAAKPEEIETIMEGVPDIVPVETQKMLIPKMKPEVKGPKTEIKKEIKKEKILEKLPKETPKELKKKATKVTIDDLRKKYGALSKVTTKSGKVYIGSFKQEGAKVEIITANGPVHLNPMDIQKVEKY